METTNPAAPRVSSRGVNPPSTGKVAREVPDDPRATEPAGEGGGEATARVHLSAELTSAREARRFVLALLRQWECDGLSETTQLLVTELVTNAILHARSEIDLTVRLGDAALRVEVGDRSNRIPIRHRYDPDAATGRGLALVEALSTTWGVSPSGIEGWPGKTVWFELPV